jgi:predicted DNA-binding transcriptional regulator YafY
MYNPTSRVLAVLALLQTHGHMTGAQMAQRLEVNIRTLRRYITILQDLGVPIVAERGRAGSYELTKGYKLPPMFFTNDEALALSIGLLSARKLGLAEMARAIESAQAKLEQVMPLDLQEQMRALTDTVVFDLNISPTTLPRATLLVMSQAAQMQQRVDMRYRSRADEETARQFDPYGLTFYQGQWYVVGFCCLRQALRSFRLNRVMQASLTDISFERPLNFDPLAYFVHSVATLPRRFSFEVLLKTDLVTAESEIVDLLGVLEPHPEGVRLQGSTDDLDWFARMLAGFSFDFSVVHPDALNEALRHRAAMLLKLLPPQDLETGSSDSHAENS